ncbi:MAG: hypothetical protein KIG77_06960 [Treponema sp.]|uniref:hypothetical protein n=1 Tax=Treponema sp. TaxID=166 RepID=UPI001E0E1287|nr:hypothetical protein [Treponema sp.]MBS7242099.1 hypothetical protein [Treponema sp.]
MVNIFSFPGSGKKAENSSEEKTTTFEYEKLVGKICHSKEFCKTGMILAVKKDAKDRIQYLVSDVDAGLGLISDKDLLEKWDIED